MLRVGLGGDVVGEPAGGREEGVRAVEGRHHDVVSGAMRTESHLEHTGSGEGLARGRARDLRESEGEGEGVGRGSLSERVPGYERSGVGRGRASGYAASPHCTLTPSG